MPHEMNTDLERALKSLRPAAAQIDPLAAAFTAGRRSRARTLRAWQSLAGTLALLSLLPMLLPAHQAPTSEPPSPPSAQQALLPVPAPESLFRLEQTVQQHGIDALPSISPAPITPLHLNNL